jgi:hypothetical protein
MKYTFKISGSDANCQFWETSGVVINDTKGSFGAVPDAVLRDTFFNLQEKLDHPCKGPYYVTRMLIEACD